MTTTPVEMALLDECADWHSHTQWEGERALWVTGACPRHDRDKVPADIDPDTGKPR